MQKEKREDWGMGYLLQYENVAYFYEDRECVEILDRRVYPEKKEKIICKDYLDVANAIKNMATQSGGQFMAAAMGMALASLQFKNMDKDAYILKMKEACEDIKNARPTTKEELTNIANSQFNLFKELIEKGAGTKDIIISLKNNAIDLTNTRYRLNAKAGEHFAKIVKDGDAILTHCFGETCFGGFLRSFNEDKKKVHIYCQETRPFLQGARLTASLAFDMGFHTSLVTDAMAAHLMSKKKINYFVSAADVITKDGHVVNKIGTFNTAIIASYFSLPYYAIGIISKKHSSIENIKIEMRDASDVLKFNGAKITSDGVEGLYPAFDITPPSLVSGIATENGIISPKDILND